ncbi:MAG: hypothetical protein A3J42_01740 [Candidatus Dadabacteria bacterium RIFCSPHIGHO2_12_FULL_53_21]|nr:MAG: hypothetical protein A3J42_01740 [Candidatus Dadabacteria bacterium RIFCSPHIGHO2_12_FULL_53_21]
MDGTELFDRHIKEHTANGNIHPGENWYEVDFREGDGILAGFTDLDWHALKKMFGNRTHIWQEACVYVLGESDYPGSANMLADVFVRGQDNISCYSSIFLSELNLDTFVDETKRLIRLRAHDLFKDGKYRQYGEHYRIHLEKIREKLRPV